MMAACHLLAAIPNFLVLEFHGWEIPWWEEMRTGDKPFVRDGWMEVSESLGSGLELDDEAAKGPLWEGDVYFD